MEVPAAPVVRAGKDQIVEWDSLKLFVVSALASFAVPLLALILLLAGLAAQMVLVGLALTASATSRRRDGVVAGPRAPGPLRFSVHVATHDEPPALVLRTLRSLARQVAAPAFDVIVLDNNTADPALWRPVEAFCRTAGPRFCFMHESGVTGAKAGALNIALARTDRAATHVVVVDADYEVAPDFLAVAAREIARRDDDFIQFPQAYRHADNGAAGLSLELADYFSRHARRADGAHAMLLTGTLSVIRRSALVAAGGWSARTLTEDAELGLRLQRLGYRGRFVDRIVGRGVMPLDLDGLATQRYRWAAGNVGTILTGLSGLSWPAAVHVAAQLTAWANFGLVFAAGLIGGGLAVALGVEVAALPLLVSLSGLGLALVVLASGLPLILSALVRRECDARTVLVALSARITLIVPSALATVDALAGRRVAFRRTMKDPAGATGEVGPVLPALALTGAGLLASAALPPLGVLGAMLLAIPYPLALGTRARIAAYRASLEATR